MAGRFEEDIEHCCHEYNSMCTELRRCKDSLRLFRLRPLIRTLKRTKTLLGKLICAYVQVTLIRRRIQTLDDRIRRQIDAGSRAVTFQILNESEVHKGVLRMYTVYAATNLHTVQVTLDRCQQRLTTVMRP